MLSHSYCLKFFYLTLLNILLSCGQILASAGLPGQEVDTADDAYIEFLRGTTGRICTRTPTRVGNSWGYVQVESYVDFEPWVLERVFTERTQPVEILDACAGSGNFLNALSRDPRFSTTPVRYTAVEIAKDHIESIRTIWSKLPHAMGSKGGVSHKSFQDYVQTNPDEKMGKVDILFSGYGFHVFKSTEFIEAFAYAYGLLKDGGLLCCTQAAGYGGAYSDDYLKAVLQGDILPFWTKNHNLSSDPLSMKRLLKTFGFRVLHMELYRQHHASSDKPLNYLGFIAEKDPTLAASPYEQVRYFTRARQIFEKRWGIEDLLKFDPMS